MAASSPSLTVGAACRAAGGSRWVVGHGSSSDCIGVLEGELIACPQVLVWFISLLLKFLLLIHILMIALKLLPDYLAFE